MHQTACCARANGELLLPRFTPGAVDELAEQVAAVSVERKKTRKEEEEAAVALLEASDDMRRAPSTTRLVAPPLDVDTKGL